MLSVDLVLFNVGLVVLFIFFFKQKTAYEMRISDWSSDVCSSDLAVSRGREPCCAPSASRSPDAPCQRSAWASAATKARSTSSYASEIGRASCRERVCQYV